MNYQLAQINIAKMIAPLDSPVMADFVANLDRINELAESDEGFVWRLKDEGNNATEIKVYDDSFLLVNMSVWKNLDSLFRYVYQSDHVEIFKRRKEWFEKMQQMHMVCWYIPAGTIPTVQEAVHRLDYIRQHGETPFAFTFRRKVTVEEFTAFKSSKLSVL